MDNWLKRYDDASMPYSHWHPFSDDDTVEVRNVLGESRIGKAKDFWWGWERNNPEGVIWEARKI